MSKPKSIKNVRGKQGIKVQVHNSPPPSIPLNLPTSPDVIPAFAYNDSIVTGDSRISAKSINCTLSPKSSNPGSILSRKGFRSPLSPKSMEFYHDAQPSIKADKTGSRHVYTEQEQLKTNFRNEGHLKSDLKVRLEKEKQGWSRSAPADLFYKPGPNYSRDLKIIYGTNNLVKLCKEFRESLLNKAELIRANLPKYEPLPRKKRIFCSVKKHGDGYLSRRSSSDSSESESEDGHTDEELEHKKKHPLRLHQELWFNDPGETINGPLCRCSAKAQRCGIRHNIYAGENHLPLCDPNSNNADKLYHYRITVSPATNFLVATPTIIKHDDHEYIFEGFSMFSHKKLNELPLCKVIRFNIEYTIVYYEESFPENFTINELNLFYSYLFHELLELMDLDLRAAGDPQGCPQYHFMPRFVRGLPGNGKEILSMDEVLNYLLQSAHLLIQKEDLTKILAMPQYDWQCFTNDIRGMLVTYPGKKPCSLRVDQLDRDQETSSEPEFPKIVHFGARPSRLIYSGNPEYKKTWREYVKFRHLLANKPKLTFKDKQKLEALEIKLYNIRMKSKLKRNVTVTVSSENFHKTGIMCDVVQHAMLIPVLVTHLRFHQSLDVLEEKIKYKFSNRYLLQLALTHPSYNENFGTNPDHARNSLTNCGIRQPVIGYRKLQNTRKRGINTLIKIMARFGKKNETESQITHNERLEFLGDAVVEFVTSIHLFHLFPDLEEGGLATYRSAIVQNQYLAVLARTLRLEEFMLYAHGSHLCHNVEIRHAMANCFEALMGALFLDGGIEVADRVFGETLFHYSDDLLDVWVNYPPHILQEQEPLGDRKWISKFLWLKSLTKFEESIGVQFTHIRLLARAFTDRSVGYTNLTLGSNQRLEWLGDTVLQLVVSEYLYRYFPEHHEGHLSLLRSSLVNNQTQAEVSNDLGLMQYALYAKPKAEFTTKNRADLLEAFLGALYVDQDLEFCKVFCDVCFFPSLKNFIMRQDWNDPKSKLQQCCLTLRAIEGGKPEIPTYKVIESTGPSNRRIFTVAVYFQNQRLAKGSGNSIQQAEKNAAKQAMKNSKSLFPLLQNRVSPQSINSQMRGEPCERSASPSTKKNLPSEGDVFSQNVRCQASPLAYQTTRDLVKNSMSGSRRAQSTSINPKKGNKMLYYPKVKRTRSRLRSTPLENHNQTNWLSKRHLTINKLSKLSNPISITMASQKIGFANLEERELSRTTCRKSKSPDKTQENDQKARRLFQSFSKSSEVCKKTKSPPCFSDCKMSPVRSSKTSIPKFQKAKQTQSNSRLQTQSRDISPLLKTRSPQCSGKSFPLRATNAPMIHRNLPSRDGSPPLRARIPSNRARSPSIRAVSPLNGDESPQSFQSCRKTPYRSPPGGGSSSRENIQKNMMDYMLGKRSSPGLETNGRGSNVSFLYDLMFDQPTLELPQQVYSSSSNNNLTNCNPQPSNQMNTDFTQVYNQSGCFTDWRNSQYSDPRIGSSTSSNYNNTAASHPSYHY